MIKIEATQVHGFEAAIRGMRNPLNSWSSSDSGWEYVYEESLDQMVCEYIVGEKDLKLMHKLAAAGNDHGKFLRMINVTCDITAPLYWWKEMDTYKVGTVRNSCSTMHRITSKPFETSDFSADRLIISGIVTLDAVINELNKWRGIYLKGGTNHGPKDKEVWWQIIQLLPSSYNQLATWQANYAVLKNIYHARLNHKLDEWHAFCDWIESLPLSTLITGKECTTDRMAVMTDRI